MSSGPGVSGGNQDMPAESARVAAHEVLGQAHALLGFALEENVLVLWCPEETLEDMRATRFPLWEAIAHCQMEVASGRHDNGLSAVGP